MTNEHPPGVVPQKWSETVPWEGFITIIIAPFILGVTAKWMAVSFMWGWRLWLDGK